VAAAELFLGHPVDASVAASVRLPGRLGQRGDPPLEIGDGAHNLAGVGYLLPRLPRRRYVVVASILSDKDADGMLSALSVVADAFVATTSSNVRSLPPEDLARRAARWIDRVEA